MAEAKRHGKTQGHHLTALSLLFICHQPRIYWIVLRLCAKRGAGAQPAREVCDLGPGTVIVSPSIKLGKTSQAATEKRTLNAHPLRRLH